MIKISLCTVIRDDVKTLLNCLSSVKDISDEIIIVDTSENDNCKAIIDKYIIDDKADIDGHKPLSKDLVSNKKIRYYKFIWDNSMANAKNFAMSKAKMDYILFLEPNEYISTNSQKSIIDLKEKMNEDKASNSYIDVVFMQHEVHRNIKYNIDYIYKPTLFRNDREYFWANTNLEYLYIWGNITYSNIIINENI